MGIPHQRCTLGCTMVGIYLPGCVPGHHGGYIPPWVCVPGTMLGIPLSVCVYPGTMVGMLLLARVEVNVVIPAS